MEVLSPVGCQENLEVAIANGADAVYLGVSLFNARRFAANFKLSGLRDTVLQAHLHGVKVYLTMNTLVRNTEIDSWFKAVEKAYIAGVDAIIIQEVSFAPILRELFPGMEIHASTQASVMNYHSTNVLSDFDLFVLAREMTRDQIELVRKHTKKKLEVFVHGHLCISYSGQCLISSMIGSRSGNRGVCASSCRKQYNGTGYRISAKDLNLSDSVKDMYDLGIDSIKIEGRMKSADYVGSVTGVYKKQVEAAEQGIAREVTTDETNLMKMGFNRDYTHGFYNKVGSIIGHKLPMNRGIKLGVVKNSKIKLEYDLNKWDGISIWHEKNNGKLTGFLVNTMYKEDVLIESAKKGEAISLPSKKVLNGSTIFLTSRRSGDKPYNSLGKKIIAVTVTASEGEYVKVTMGDKIIISDIKLEKSEKHALTQEQLQEVFNKHPLVDFEIESCSITGDLFFPRSKQTELKDTMMKVVVEEYLPSRKSEMVLPKIERKQASTNRPRLMVKVYLIKDIKRADDKGAHYIYYDVFGKEPGLARRQCKNAKFFLDTPVVMSDEDILRAKKIIAKVKPDGIMAGNIGMIDAYEGAIHGKYSLNTFNDISIKWLQSKGVLPMTSVELSGQQILQLRNKDFIYYAHGRIPVMHFKGIYDERVLRDEKEYVFPLRIVNGNTEMLHSRPFAVLERIRTLIEGGVMYFFLDLDKDVEDILETYQLILLKKEGDISLMKKETTIKPFKMGVG